MNISELFGSQWRHGGPDPDSGWRAWRFQAPQKMPGDDDPWAA